MLLAPYLYLCRAKIFEHAEVRLLAQPVLQGLGNNHHIDVVGRPFEENIAHKTTNNITFHAHFIGHIANKMEHLLIEYLR